MAPTWLHCNKCTRLPDGTMTYVLTSCGHIFCSKCFQAGKDLQCLVCNAKCTAHMLTSKLPTSTIRFFKDLRDIKQESDIEHNKIANFQNSQQKRLLESLIEQNKKLKTEGQKVYQMYQNAKEDSKTLRNLEEEHRIVKEENVYLKKLLAQQSVIKTKSNVKRLANASPQSFKSSPNWPFPIATSRRTSKDTTPDSQTISDGRVSITPPPSLNATGFQTSMSYNITGASSNIRKYYPQSTTTSNDVIMNSPMNGQRSSGSIPGFQTPPTNFFLTSKPNPQIPLKTSTSRNSDVRFKPITLPLRIDH